MTPQNGEDALKVRERKRHTLMGRELSNALIILIILIVEKKQ